MRQKTVVPLRFLSYVVAIFLLAACGSSSAVARHTPATSADASPTASPLDSPSGSPAGSPSPQASPTPILVGKYAVLVNMAADTYTVSIVGIDGRVLATAQPSSPTQVTCGDAAAAVVPMPVSTSNSRAYFMDAQGNINFLAPNGTTGNVYRLPTGGGTRNMFAVSPDDTQMAVVVVTYSASGATTKLYMDQLQQGGSQTLLFTESGAYTLWPIGWHGANNLVVAKVPACTQGGGAFCCGPLELHVVDPATAVRRFTMGGSQCVIAGSPSQAGAVCENNPNYTKATVVNWSGGTVSSFAIQAPTYAYLSPDGSAIALVSNSSTTFVGLKQTLDLNACGWIDTKHVIAGGDVQQQARIGDVTTGSIVPVNAQGLCAGTIPGTL
jgi:hypothetical protein